MKKLCDISDPVHLSLIKSELDNATIQYVIKNDFPPGMDAYFGGPVPEVWIMYDANFSEALRCLENVDKPTGEDWTCPQCGEKLEGQFNECWQCAYLRE